MEELRRYLNNLNLTSRTLDAINKLNDRELGEIFSIKEIEEQGDFGNAKALYVESLMDAYNGMLKILLS